MKKLVSVVIPAYNEEENIVVIIERLGKVFECLNYDYEILLVDDGSSDQTLAVYKTMAKVKSNLFFIEFSRNFGHQSALKAGLDESKGDCVISLDADLQHPPELTVKLLPTL